MLFKFKKIEKKDLILWVLILIPYLLLVPTALWYFNKLNNIENSAFIIINKADMTLSLYNYKGELLQKSGVATGKNFGSKQFIGDFKTPEGVFTIASIEDVSNWSHDFKDSLGVIKGAYGPYFIRLDVPGQKGIGIHGTHDENSIGGRVSEGCIRMHNIDLRNLVEKIKTASVVVIAPGLEDVKVNMLNNDTVLTKLVSPKTKTEKKKLLVKENSKTKPSYKTLLQDKNKK